MQIWSEEYSHPLGQKNIAYVATESVNQKQ